MMEATNVCLSVVIPYYQKWPRTKFLIESLNRQTFDKKYEVIIVDDGSSPSLKSSIDGVKTHFPLQIIEQKNGGRSNARNSGARIAKGEILVFVDDDMILFPDFLEQHYKKHMSCNHEIFVHGDMYDLVELTSFKDPESGEYFEFIKNTSKVELNGRGRISFESVFLDWESFIRKRRRTSRLEKLIQTVISNPKLADMHWIGCVGGNVSIKKDVFNKVGGYDSKFVFWGGEDFELGYRLRLNGVEAEEIPFCCYHMTHAHVAYFEKRKMSEEYFLKKYDDENIKNLYDFLEKKIDQDQFISLIGG